MREVQFIASLSDQTRYMRMLTPLRFLPPHLLDKLMDIDYDRRMAFVATLTRAGTESIIAVVRYGVTDDAETAELGVTVTDAWQGRGVAQLLVLHLIRFARWRGLKRLVGIVLPENQKMLALARSTGFSCHFDSAAYTVRIDLDLAHSAQERSNCASKSPGADGGELRVAAGHG